MGTAELLAVAFQMTAVSNPVSKEVNSWEVFRFYFTAL